MDNPQDTAAPRAAERRTADPKPPRQSGVAQVQPERLPLDLIRRDGNTQPRDHIDQDVVKRYADGLARGAVFPPITVFHDGAGYWLADGFHRLEAHKIEAVPDIAVDVREGTMRDAILFSVGANAATAIRAATRTSAVP